MSPDAAVSLDGDVLRLAGRLDRAAVPSLWRRLEVLRGRARLVDLAEVERVDSAGLALLSELASGGVRIEGSPVGLSELRAAYRLDDALGFRS